MMRSFAVVLFALLALFAHLVPATSARAIELAKRETNADRFARGLPPLPPTRRETSSLVNRDSAQPRKTSRVEVRNAQSGETVGYLGNAPDGPNGISSGQVSDLSVTYDHNTHTLYCESPAFNGGAYLGGVIPIYDLAQGSPNYVSLANVNTNNPQDEAGIWNHNINTGELTGWWVNLDNTFVIISYVYDPATKSIAIVADIASYLGMNPSSYQVGLYLAD